jgi:DNA-binding transcriptional regulator YiaG
MSIAPFWTDAEVEKLLAVLPTAKRKSDLTAHFPGRTWSAIVQKSRTLGLRRREWWTRAEEALLIEIYERETRYDIMRALPRREWPAIQRKASELCIKRDQRKTRTAFALVAELRRIRRQPNIHSDALGLSFNTYGSSVSAWESGKRTPTLPVLLRWAEALNMEIVLQPKGLRANTAKALIDRPVEGRLMARNANRMR